MNPKNKYRDDLSISQSSNEWNMEWEYVQSNEGDYDYLVDYPSGPLCKVVWVIDGKRHEKEYSKKEHAIEKQKSLLLKKIPAIIKAC